MSDDPIDFGRDHSANYLEMALRTDRFKTLERPDGRGRKVLAPDFVYSFNRILNPETASPGAWIFHAADREHPGGPFTALDDSTLEIRLHDPFPAFPGLLTMPYCFVVPQEVVEKEGRDFRSNPVGTGPFRFQYWKEDEK